MNSSPPKRAAQSEPRKSVLGYDLAEKHGYVVVAPIGGVTTFVVSGMTTCVVSGTATCVVSGTTGGALDVLSEGAAGGGSLPAWVVSEGAWPRTRAATNRKPPATTTNRP
jgi:hypothetical protein